MLIGAKRRRRSDWKFGSFSRVGGRATGSSAFAPSSISAFLREDAIVVIAPNGVPIVGGRWIMHRIVMRMHIVVAIVGAHKRERSIGGLPTCRCFYWALRVYVDIRVYVLVLYKEILPRRPWISIYEIWVSDDLFYKRCLSHHPFSSCNRFNRSFCFNITHCDEQARSSKEIARSLKWFS